MQKNAKQDTAKQRNTTFEQRAHQSHVAQIAIMTTQTLLTICVRSSFSSAETINYPKACPRERRNSSRSETSAK